MWMIHDMPDASDKEPVSLPPELFRLLLGHFHSSLSSQCHSTVAASDVIASQNVSESQSSASTEQDGLTQK